VAEDSVRLGVAAAQIVEEIAHVHEDSYGRPPSNLRIAVAEDFFTVIAEVELTPAELALARAGKADAVRTTREAFAEAIRPVFEAIVERATGRRVEAFASRLDPVAERPWSADIFLLAPVEPEPSAPGAEF
jgi:uncharacterized protein YbcI